MSIFLVKNGFELLCANMHPTATLLVVALLVSTPLSNLSLVYYTDTIIISGMHPDTTLLVVVLPVCTPLSNESSVLDTD